LGSRRPGPPAPAQAGTRGAIIQFEDQTLRHWTNRVTDDYLQRELLADYNHRGTTLIRAMEKEMISTDADKNSASTIRQVEVRLHREAGISSTTVLAFNNFINRDADLNATLTGTARHEDDDMRALALREVLSAHLEPIFTRIVVEENRIKTHGLVTSTMRQEGARHSIFNSTPLAVCGDGGRQRD
jgi:hypothetical protein